MTRTNAPLPRTGGSFTRKKDGTLVPRTPTVSAQKKDQDNSSTTSANAAGKEE